MLLSGDLDIFSFVRMSLLNWIVHINTLKTNRRLLYLKTQFVPRSKHFSSRFKKTNTFMLYGANVAVCSQVNTKHINKMWKNVKFLNVKPVAASRNQ
jgi:hypothetical protein